MAAEPNLTIPPFWPCLGRLQVRDRVPRIIAKSCERKSMARDHSDC